MTQRLIRLRRGPLLLALVLLASAFPAAAADWSDAARQLARKITAESGPIAVALTFKNTSSAGQGEVSDARRALELALRAGGVRFAAAEQATALLRVTLSESVTGYVWVAELHRSGAQEDDVLMVGVPRPDAGMAPRVAASVSIRKQVLWFQAEAILDVAVLDAASSTPRLLVLDPERVALYRKNAGRWEVEQQFPIAHALQHSYPRPRDLRGRLMTRKDHLFDAFLPGVACASSAKSPYTLSCHEGDDPWPLAVADQPPQYASYNAQRDFFSGALRPGFGDTRATAPFYSAAGLPRPNYTLWILAGVDGATRVTDGSNERVIAPRGWGSDVAVVMNGCGGPQALITAAGDANAADSVVALDVMEREPAVVSQPLEFSGPVTALWSAPDGAGVLAVSKNLKTGQYEAYTLTLACGQ